MTEPPEPTILGHKSLEPPNRFAAFTNDELEDIKLALELLVGEAFDDHPARGAMRLVSEIDTELKRRRKA